MKTCTVFFNCFGGEIVNQLKASKTFCKTYNIQHIALYDYLEGYKYGNKKELIKEHKNLVNNCDLLILQYIKKDREVIKHTNIISFTNKNCKIILIPHYTFSGYNYPFDIINDNNIKENMKKKELMKYIDNLHFDKKQKIILYKDSELENIKNLDQNSSIKCYEFVANNFNKYRLFNSRSYPTYIFFHYIAQEILYNININELIKPIWSKFGLENSHPILPVVFKYLKLDFGNNFNYKCNLYEYIICCKKLKVNDLYLINRKKGRTHINELKQIIESKNYI